MRIYSLLQSRYWKVKAYPGAEYRRFLDASQHWSREQLESYRNEKLQRLIRHCYDHVPYYRRVMKEYRLQPRDIRSGKDLSKFPVLSKDLIRSCSREMLAENVSTMRLNWARTGGTTGEPIRVCKDEKCEAWGNMCFERGLKWGGIRWVARYQQTATDHAVRAYFMW
jgi:phenylacetate-CoA ligase